MEGAALLTGHERYGEVGFLFPFESLVYAGICEHPRPKQVTRPDCRSPTQATTRCYIKLHPFQNNIDVSHITCTGYCYYVPQGVVIVFLVCSIQDACPYQPND